MEEIIDLPNRVPLPEDNIPEYGVRNRHNFQAIREEYAALERNVMENRRVVGDIEDGTVAEPKPVYLKSYFDTLFFLGLCPFNGSGDYSKSKYCWIPFILFSALAIFQYIVAIKSGLSIYFFVLLCQIKIPALLKSLVASPSVQPNLHILVLICTSTIIICSGIFLAIAYCAHLDEYFKGTSAEEIFLDYAGDLSEAIFQWNFTDVYESAFEIREEHAANITGESVFFGTTQWWSYIDFWLQRYLMNDIFFILSIGLYFVARACHFRIESTEALNNNTIRMAWRFYKFVHIVSTKINDCFGTLINLVHVDNWFQFSFFLFNCYKGDIKWFRSMITLTRICQSLLAYFLAFQTSKLEDQTRYHLYKLADSTIEDPNEDNLLMQYIVFIDRKLKIFPPGIGTGSFRINGAFLLKLTASVLSFFLLLADTLTFTQISDRVDQIYNKTNSSS